MLTPSCQIFWKITANKRALVTPLIKGQSLRWILNSHTSTVFDVHSWCSVPDMLGRGNKCRIAVLWWWISRVLFLTRNNKHFLRTYPFACHCNTLFFFLTLKFKKFLNFLGFSAVSMGSSAIKHCHGPQMRSVPIFNLLLYWKKILREN